jgi:GNAT superfamily N-acetyltransferase
MAFDAATYTPADREDYLRLLADAWGDAAVGGDEFDWWFRGPAGALRSIARSDGTVVGAAAQSWLRMIVDGREARVTFSLHAVTDASARGQGIFAALESKHEVEAERAGAAAVISVPAESAASVFLGKLGWTSIAKLRLWARPLPRLARRVRVERLEQFDHDGDAAAGWPENHVVRDREHLTWRYLDSPRGYVALRAGDGYAVVGHKRQRGQRVAYVADLVGDDTRALLSACLAAARPGSRALLALPPRTKRAAYASGGFLPTPLTLHFMGKGLAQRLDADPRAWRLTLGDTDFF